MSERTPSPGGRVCRQPPFDIEKHPLNTTFDRDNIARITKPSGKDIILFNFHEEHNLSAFHSKGIW